jgi:hypothetical protein
MNVPRYSTNSKNLYQPPTSLPCAPHSSLPARFNPAPPLSSVLLPPAAPPPPPAGPIALAPSGPPHRRCRSPLRRLHRAGLLPVSAPPPAPSHRSTLMCRPKPSAPFCAPHRSLAHTPSLAVPFKAKFIEFRLILVLKF